MKNEDVTWILDDLENRLKSLSGKDFFKVQSFITNDFFPRLFEVQEFKTFYESKIITDFSTVLWTDTNFLSALDGFLQNLQSVHKEIDSTQERSEDFQRWIDKAKKDFSWNVSREEVKDYFDGIERKESPEKFRILFEDFLSPLSKRSGAILVMSEETGNSELSISQTKEILKKHELKHKLYKLTEKLGKTLAPKDFITSQYIKLYRFWCLDENAPARNKGDNNFYYWIYKFTKEDFDLVEVVESAKNTLHHLRKEFKLFPLELRNGRLHFGGKSTSFSPELLKICEAYLSVKPSEKVLKSNFYKMIYDDNDLNLSRDTACKKQVDRLNKRVKEELGIKNSPFHFGNKIYRSL